MRIRRWFAVTLCGLVLAPATVARAGQKSADSVAVTLSASALDQYVGQYHGAEEPDAVDSVYREGDKLYIESERKARAELRAEATDRFAG